MDSNIRQENGRQNVPDGTFTTSKTDFGSMHYEPGEFRNFSRIFKIIIKRLHAAFLRTNAQLNAELAQRSYELAAANERIRTEEALHKQKELGLRKEVAAATEASKAKTFFLGNMSHELRTPLNAIIGFSEMIQSEVFGPAGSPKYIEYADDIKQSGMYLLQLINELLDVSRIEAGHLTLSLENLDLTYTLRTCFHMLETKAKERQVILSGDIIENLPLMRGDQIRIKQVFVNLIDNAIKFTPPEGSVRVSASVLPDGAVMIIVADTGIGIAPGDLMKVCEIYGQANNSLTRADEGAGLGLPLAKALCERHGGTLEIASEVGRGTTITVIFPASVMVKKLAVSQKFDRKIIG
ncbi:MAG: sensor histidine kinase [Pseudomonadota bacterium]